MTMDSAGVAGPSPMQALGFALAGCMAMDVVHVLKKGRHDLRGLKVSLAPTARRRIPTASPPSPRLHRDRQGAARTIQRAIDLSRDKYCSVWHSLRQDIELLPRSTSLPNPMVQTRRRMALTRPHERRTRRAAAISTAARPRRADHDRGACRRQPGRVSRPPTRGTQGR